jgi:hypothetical protein
LQRQKCGESSHNQWRPIKYQFGEHQQVGSHVWYIPANYNSGNEHAAHFSKLVPWLFTLTSRSSDILRPLKMWLWSSTTTTTTTTLAPWTWPLCNFFSFLRMKLQLTQCCCQDVPRIQEQSLTILQGVVKSLARPGGKQATATEDFEFHISYL